MRVYKHLIVKAYKDVIIRAYKHMSIYVSKYTYLKSTNHRNILAKSLKCLRAWMSNYMIT